MLKESCEADSKRSVTNTWAKISVFFIIFFIDKFFFTFYSKPYLKFRQIMLRKFSIFIFVIHNKDFSRKQIESKLCYLVNKHIIKWH